MRSFSFSDAKADLKAVMDLAVADRMPIAITRPDAEGVVIIAEDEWAAIEETLCQSAASRSA